MDKKIDKEDILNSINTEENNQGFWRKHWGKILFLLLIGVGGYLYYTTQLNEVETRYNTTKMSKRDLIIKVSATGNIEPTNSVDVGIEVSGTIDEVLVDYNDKVTTGQILAKLDTIKLLSQVNNSKASLDVAKANLNEAQISIDDTKQELERLLSLYKSTNGDYPNKQSIDKAKIAFQKTKALYIAYQAKVSQASALLKANEDDLKKAVVVSPIDGIVLDRKIEVGQSVVANMQIPILFTLAQDLKKMQVLIRVDEADIGKIQEKQRVEFSVDAYTKKLFNGTIRQVRLNAQMVDGVVTYEVVVDVDNTDLLLRPGMTVSADIITQKIEGSYTIPNTALRFSPSANISSARKYMFAPRPKKQQKKKTKEKSIWILEDSMPTKVSIDVGMSDGIYTVVKGDDITPDTPIIISIKESSDE